VSVIVIYILCIALSVSSIHIVMLYRKIDRHHRESLASPREPSRGLGRRHPSASTASPGALAEVDRLKSLTDDELIAEAIDRERAR
jgi:hypothetical protein